MMSRLIALCLSLLLPLSALAQAPQAPVEGRDYVRLDEPGRWQAGAPGSIEVVELFAYSCGHCDQFRPMLDAWKRRAGKDVVVHTVPAAYDPGDAYGRGHFALEAMGAIARMHPVLFDAIHREGSLPARGASILEFSSFLAGHGFDPAQVRTQMSSAATDAKMNAARAFAVRSGLQGTPTLIINGKYRVQGRTLQDSLRIADALVAMERALPR